MSTIRSAPPPMIPPRPQADARAAFFRAVTSPETVQRQAPQAQAAPTVQPQPAASANSSASPQRMLRPGSIIDIKV